MSLHKELHKTDEKVMETGKYICAAGKTQTFQEGDTFAKCPVSGEPTTWRHADHVHKSGELVTESGAYADKDDEKVELEEGSIFPNCPKSGQPTEWRHVQ